MTKRRTLRPISIRPVDRREIVADTLAGKAHVRWWLCRIEVFRIQLILGQLYQLLDSMGYHFNSEQRDCVRADIARAENMLLVFQARLKATHTSLTKVRLSIKAGCQAHRDVDLPIDTNVTAVKL